MQNDATTISHDSKGVDPLGTDNVADRIEMILQLTGELCGLIEAETTHLEHHRPSELSQSEAKKAQLSALYAREMRAISARPELLHGATSAQKQSLQESAENFRATVANHTRRLVHARVVTEALVVAVGEELNKRRNPATRYAKPYGKSGALNSASMRPATIAFSHDRSI